MKGVWRLIENFSSKLIRLFLLVCLIWFMILNIDGVSGQGLQFNGGHKPINERTSVEFFHEYQAEFKHQLDIKFELALNNSNPIGYVLRIKNKERATILNLHYDEEGDDAVLRLNEEGKTSLITLTIKKEDLHKQRWFPVHIHLDMDNDKVSLSANDTQLRSQSVDLPRIYNPSIIFGKSDHLIDVPPIAIRNLSIGNDERSYVFPFLEHVGTSVHDKNGTVLGKVSNPIWLINDSYHWKNTFKKSSLQYSGSDYNKLKSEVYYFNKDSITIYSIRTNESKSYKFASPCPVNILLGNSFVDEKANKLYVYETFYEKSYNGPAVASLDLSTLLWAAESNNKPNIELHHHSSFYNAKSGTFTLFGGYGAMLYSNQFYRYSLKDGTWRTLPTFQGDHIIPRYFSSAGYRSDNPDIVYLFGGMGNEAGKHIIGRKYFYDLYELDMKKGELRKKWALPGEQVDFVPARGIVIPNSNHLYLLGYPEHLTNSFIKLYRYNIHNGQHVILGDSIPIFSDRISTRAKLYYDEIQKKLITLVQESADDTSSTLTVFALDFPPISEGSLNAFPQRANPTMKIVLSTLGILLASGLALFIRNTKKSLSIIKKPDTVEVKPSVQAEERKKNCILLFGDFTVINQDGRDISHLFSLRLRQLFCLLLSKTNNNGISSQLLNHMLWPDKEKEKAKTLRGVTINNLRKVLNELSGAEVVFDKGHFHLLITGDCYCDYLECMRLVAEKPETRNTDQYLSILSRGKFLLGTDDIVFDKLKEETESTVIPILLQDLQFSAINNRPYKTIQIADCIFQFDPINEQALCYSIKAKIQTKQETKAHELYYHFAADYQNVMAEKFTTSFHDLLKIEYRIDEV